MDKKALLKNLENLVEVGVAGALASGRLNGNATVQAIQLLHEFMALEEDQAGENLELILNTVDPKLKEEFANLWQRIQEDYKQKVAQGVSSPSTGSNDAAVDVFPEFGEPPDNGDDDSPNVWT